ncbi:MAG: ribosome-binding factor A [Candidatus Gracilibacteria bacterium]|jgi:ribosome-binding factor A|nr:ribosome-binding factor A [Candidatus Gracilibacteria bacterium]
MSVRTEKIASTIQQEISPLIIKHFNEHKFGLITVKKVIVLDDLSLAKIYINSMKHENSLIKELEKKSWKIAKEIGGKQRIAFKKIPKLEFCKYENDINNLLDSI